MKDACSIHVIEGFNLAQSFLVIKPDKISNALRRPTKDLSEIWSSMLLFMHSNTSSAKLSNSAFNEFKVWPKIKKHYVALFWKACNPIEYHLKLFFIPELQKCFFFLPRRKKLHGLVQIQVCTYVFIKTQMLKYT